MQTIKYINKKQNAFKSTEKKNLANRKFNAWKLQTVSKDPWTNSV